MSSKVIIIGGSYAGSRAAKAILQSKLEKKVELTLISPSEYSLNCVSLPRILIEPEKIDKLFFDLKAHLEKLAKPTGNTFRYVKDYVTSVDIESKTVSYSGGVLQYDQLVIASGASSQLVFKLESHEDHEFSKAKLLKLAETVKNAASIAIIGGGPTGVEVAGEFGEHYKTKKTVLVTGTSGPLSGISNSVISSATEKLSVLGVEIINDKKVKSFTEQEITFQDGETSSFDVVIPTFTYIPNSQFLPTELLDPKGYVLTDENLNVPNHAEILVYGDIISGSSRTILELEYGTHGTLKAWVNKIVFGSAGALKEYKKVASVSALVVPISRLGGIAYIYGWSLPNFVTKYVKAKAFMVDDTAKMFS